MHSSITTPYRFLFDSYSTIFFAAVKYFLVFFIGVLLLFSFKAFASDLVNTSQNTQPNSQRNNQPSTLSNSQQSQNLQPDSKKTTPVKLMVNWNHQFQFAGFYAAIAKGFYKNHGIELTILDWTPGKSEYQTLLEGNTDFIVAQNSILIDQLNDAPVKLIMSNFQYSPLILLSHRPIKSPSELAGKAIMHNGSLQIKTMINKAFQKTGIYPIEIASSGNLEDFISGKVDFYGAYNSNEPFILDRLGVEYSTVDPKVFGVQSYDGLIVATNAFVDKNPQLTSHFKQATIEGWQYALEHPEEIVDYILANYSTKKTKQDMLNEASALAEYVEPTPGSIGQIDINKLEAVLSDAKKHLNVATNPISIGKLQNLIFSDKSTLFTQQEINFLKANPVIQLANSSDWPPFDFMKHHQHQGVAKDYLKLMTQILDVEFIPTELAWPEVMKLTDSTNPIVFPAIAPSDHRNQKLFFTTPFVTFPMVLTGYNKDGFISDFRRLNDNTVAVIKDSWADDFFKQNFPLVKLHYVNTASEGLESVTEHKAIVYGGNLGAINYAINHEGFSHFNIVGRAEQNYHLSMAVPHKHPILFSIVQKALAQISPNQRQEIYEKWFPVEMVSKYSDNFFWQVTLSLSALIALLVFVTVLLFKRQNYMNKIFELSLTTTIDAKTHKILKASKSFAQLSGFSLKELEGKDYLSLASPKIPQETIDYVMGQLTHGHSWKGEFPAIKKTGEEYWVEVSYTPQTNWLGKVSKIIATRYDISDRKRIEEMSITDELTGLHNRRKFNQTLPVEVNRAKRERRNLGLIMLDIDFFKRVNDEYGHDVGDEVLIEISTSLNSYFHRSNDFIFRIGGEEFCVITQFDSIRALEVHLQNLLIFIRSLSIENKQAPLKVVTMSAGAVLCFPQHNLPAGKLLKMADQLLYESKRNGRNTLTLKVVGQTDLENE